MDSSADGRNSGDQSDNKSGRRRPRIALKGRAGGRLAVVLAVAGLIAAGWPVRTVAQATFEYTQEPDALVIQLSQDLGILDADQTPLLRVYGDGLVRIHFPVYMKRAGDYTLQLTQSELQSLLAQFVEGGLIDFSPAATRAQMRGLAAARRAQAPPGQPRPLTMRSDPTTVTIEVRLSRYVPPVGATRTDVATRIVWTGAQGDSIEFPTLEALQQETSSMTATVSF